MNTRLLSALAFSCAVALAGCPEPTTTDDAGTTPVDAFAAGTDVFVPPGVDAGPLPDAFAERPDSGPTTVSFATDVAPIITANCAGSRCHGANYAFLMGSTGCPTAVDRRFVVPGNAATSYVIAKLEGASTICGSVMPRARRLTAAQITTIRTWINEGALNN